MKSKTLMGLLAVVVSLAWIMMGQSMGVRSVHEQIFERLIRNSKAPRLRTITEFAEQEIILSSGPHAGEQFRTHIQPYSLSWFDAIGSRAFNRFVATGPTQSGKSLTALVIPWMWHQFERHEPCVIAAPKLEICEDKWLADIYPVIAASRYASELPRTGKGSQGGFAQTITFRSGSMLKFMSGGASDSGKAAWTAKNAFITEADGMDTASDVSRESDPIRQIEGRLLSFDDDARMYIECTVTIPSGLIWRGYQSGTYSKLMLPCPDCGTYVCPERADFVGWETAANEIEAEQRGRFSCNACGLLWSPEQRVLANRAAKVIHAGQSIGVAGDVSGPVPPTRTFSLRWSAVNNLFASESALGRGEWKAARDEDQESAQRQRQQQVWTIPFVSSIEEKSLNKETVASRLTGIPKLSIPNDAETLVAAVDIHDRVLYWVVLATGTNKTYSVVSYGIKHCPNPDENGSRQAILMGLNQLADELAAIEWCTEDGSRKVPIDICLADAGYVEDLVLTFVTERGLPWRLSKGVGSGYTRPKWTPDVWAYDHFHLSRQPACDESDSRTWWLTLFESDHWLHILQNGFSSPPFNDDGSRRPKTIGLFGSVASVHLSPLDRTIHRSSFSEQICAWRWGETPTKSRGTQMMWLSVYGQDHFSDALYNCLVADRVVRELFPRFRPVEVEQPQKPQQAPLTEDGRPLLVNVWRRGGEI